MGRASSTPGEPAIRTTFDTAAVRKGAGALALALLLVLILASTPAAASAGPPKGSPCTEKLKSAPFFESLTDGSPMIRVTGLRSILICRYYGETETPKPLEPGEEPPEEAHHGRGRFARSRDLRGADTVRPLARMFDGLYRYTERELKTMRCPFTGTGAGYAIVFRYADGARSSVKVYSTGCPYVADGRHVYADTVALERRLDGLVPLPDEPAYQGQ